MRNVFLCCLGLGAATTASAQKNVPLLSTGDWVRVSTQMFDANPDWRVGALAAITDTYIVIEPIGQGPLAIPHRTVTRFQLKAGRHSHWFQGGAIGAAGGVVLFAALIALTDCTFACLAAAPAGAVLGAGFGRSRSSIRWDSIAPSHVKPHNIAAGPSHRVQLVRIGF